MARRTANRLYVDEIDEISTVDIPANHKGLIAFYKRAGDAPMDEYFDEHGNPVDPDEIQVGQRVYDADGTPYVLQDPEVIEAALANGDITEDDLVDLDDADPDDDLDDNDPRLDAFDDDDDLDEDRQLAGAVGKRGSRGATAVRGRGTPATSGGAGSMTAAGRRRQQLGQGRIGKRGGMSEGQRILSELRKAYSDADRDEIISKAFDQVGEALARAERAERIAKRLVDANEGAQYVELAKSYDGLPVEPNELGRLLHTAASTFSKRDLATLERLLEVANDGGAVLDELGVTGHQSTGSGIHDEVASMAYEVVSKSGDLTHEQAMTEIYAANPEAYDAYEAERYQR